MCGNYGDPAAGKNTLDIYRYFRKINPNIILGMNTNGALQNTFYWQTLGQLFNQSMDYVIFSIDGLESTNGTYRVGCDWDKLMANANAFIAAGGSAHWDMLVYKHNQHQVEECEQLARDMGFKWFRAKVTKREMPIRLEFPDLWPRPVKISGEIDCHAIKERSMYIDAQGRLHPCCWQGSRLRDFITDDLATLKITWKSTPDAVCAAACTINKNATIFENQWQKSVQLKQ
jgi:hypothetical protein